MQKLLVSVRGKEEALEAIRGKAKIVDAENPESALGKVYPLNIWSIKGIASKHKGVFVSTNIGEKQLNRRSACQSALGVATAGADIIKVGMGGLDWDNVRILSQRIARTIRFWYPKKKVIPAFFVDPGLKKVFDPFRYVSRLSRSSRVDGILIDTYNKHAGKTLLDYVDTKMIRRFARKCSEEKIESWVAGSLNADQIRLLWNTGVDVICVRGAACGNKGDRGGRVKAEFVEELVP